MEYTIQLTFYLLHTLGPVQLGQNHRSDTAAHRWGGGEQLELKVPVASTRNHQQAQPYAGVVWVVRAALISAVTAMLCSRGQRFPTT